MTNPLASSGETKSQTSSGETKSADKNDYLLHNASFDEASFELGLPPTIAQNLKNIKALESRTMCKVTSGNVSGYNLGDEQYSFQPGGDNVSYKDIAVVIQKNYGEADLSGTPRHWLNNFFSRKYSEIEKKLVLLNEVGIYRKHLYALACKADSMGPELRGGTLLNLMKESSLVLAYALSPLSLNRTLSVDQWQKVVCEQSYADLFMNEDVKEEIKYRHTTQGSMSKEELKSNNSINYEKLILSGDEIPELLSSSSYAEAFEMLSVQNQRNLREALKLMTRTSPQYFHEFLNHFTLESGEYDELASAFAQADDSNYMLCNVESEKMGDFIKYLNSLAPGNRVSILTSARLRLSGENRVNINLEIIAQKNFNVEDLSFQNVMDIFKSLYSYGQPIYDQDSRLFSLDLNNTALKKDIDNLLTLTWKSLVRDYEQVLTLCEGGGQCSEGELLLDLFQWSDTFRSIYNQCCNMKVWQEELLKPLGKKLYIRETDDFTLAENNQEAGGGETKDEDINLRPLSSARLRKLAKTLTLNKDYKNAVKVLLMALEQSSEKKLIMDDLVKLFSNNQIRAHVKDFFLTMARTVTVFIESELKKSELDGNNGGADWIKHLVWMVELDLQRKKLLTWQGSTANFAINKVLVDELEAKTKYYSGLSKNLFAGPRSCLAEVWKKLSSFRKPGSVDWQKDLLFSYSASPGDADRLGLRKILSLDYYDVGSSDNKDELILRAVYIRLLLLLGATPEKGFDRVEAIHECFRFVEMDNQGNQVRKVAANKVRTLFIEKLIDYKWLAVLDPGTISREQRKRMEGVYSHFQKYFFSVVKFDYSFIDVLAQYAFRDTPKPIADYSSRDVDIFYVQAKSDPNKLEVLVKHTFGDSQNTTVKLSETRAKKLLTLLRSHSESDEALRCILTIVKKVKSDIDRVVSINENMQTMIWSDKYALLNESIRNAFNLFEFRLKLPGNFESVMFTQLEQLIKRLEGVTNVLYQCGKPAMLSFKCCLNSWSALDRIIHSERFLKTPDQYLQVKLMIIGCSLRGLQIYSAIPNAMYKPHILTLSYDKYQKFHAAIRKSITEVADYETVWKHVDVISARRLVFSRLLYLLHEAVRLGHSEKAIINHHVKGLSSCYQDVCFIRDNMQRSGSDMIAEFRQELKSDVRNAVEQLKKTVYPVIISKQMINFLISIIFIEGNEKENYDTLSLKQRLDNLYKPDHIGSSKFSDALVPAKESGEGHRGETKTNSPSIKESESALCRQLIVARLNICGSKHDEFNRVKKVFQSLEDYTLKTLELTLQQVLHHHRFYGFWNRGKLKDCLSQLLEEVRGCLPFRSGEEKVEVDAHKKERAQAPSSAPAAEPSASTTLFSQSNGDETQKVNRPAKEPSSFPLYDRL